MFLFKFKQGCRTSKRWCDGTRPIAIGHILLRLTGSLALFKVSNDVHKFFQPQQFGVGTKNSVELLVSKIVTKLHMNPVRVLISCDIKNAFNTFDRNKIWPAIRKHFPSLEHLVKFMYMEAGTVSIAEPTTDEVFHILSAVGSRQGCSLGSFLFALAIHENLVALQQTHNEAQIDAYLDDLFFTGPPQIALEAFSSWNKTYSTNMQGAINLNKCKVYAPSYSHQQLLDLGFPTMLQYSNDGVKVLGVPVGNHKFIISFLEAKITDIERQCDLVSHMTSQHCQLAIISKSIQHQMTFLLRNIPCGDISFLSLAARYDKAMHSVIKRICHHTKISNIASGIVRLPHSMGGLAIRSFFDMADPAFLASFVFCSTIIPNMCPDLKPKFADLRYHQLNPSDMQSPSLSDHNREAFLAFQRLNSISDHSLHDMLDPASIPSHLHLLQKPNFPT